MKNTAPACGGFPQAGAFFVYYCFRFQQRGVRVTTAVCLHRVTAAKVTGGRELYIFLRTEAQRKRFWLFSTRNRGVTQARNEITKEKAVFLQAEAMRQAARA